MLFSLVSVGLIASWLVELGSADDDDNSSGRQCKRETVGDYRFDETYCKFYVCECTDNGNTTTCDFTNTVQWFDEDNDDRLEYILDYCSYTCGTDDLVFDGSQNCTCSNVECEEGTEATPSPTAQDNGDGDGDGDTDATRTPETTDSSDRDSTPAPTDDGRGNSDATRTPETTDSSDRDGTPAPTARDSGDGDSNDATRTPETTDEKTRSTPEPTSDDGRNTPAPTARDKDSDDSDDRVETTKTRDDSDDSDDDRKTPSPTRRQDYDDDYDLDEDAEDDFLDDDSVDVIRDEDKTKPYLLTEFKLTITKAWFYRPDFDAILKRALRLLLSGSSDYVNDIGIRYIIRFEAERVEDDDNDNDGDNNTDGDDGRTDEEEDGDEDNTRDETGSNNGDSDNANSDGDNSDNSDGDGGRGRRLLETIMQRVLLEDDANRATRVPGTTDSSDDTNVRATESSDDDRVRTTDSSDDDNKVRTTDSSDDDDRYRTTVFIDDKCKEVTIKLYVGLAIYIDDIVIVGRLYNYLLELANRLGDEFAIFCANTAKEWRGCGWGFVDVYYAFLAYYDETGELVESATFTDDSDEPTSGSIKIQSVSAGLIIISSILSMFMVV